MGIARGPNIVKDNLIFGYDTGYGVADNETSTRFYPGEPTENLIYDMGGTVTSAYPQVVYRSTALETNVVDISAPGGKYSRFTGIDDSSNNQLYSQFSSYSIDVRGDSVNYSVYLKGSGTCHLTIYDNNSGYGTSPTITLTNNWVRYNYTRTVNASATTYWVAVRGILDTTNVYIAGQQATRGTHSTPYIENNRSSTQSLIDLKRTRSIDVSNVSFDSNGQPVFDGTDDVVSLGTNFDLNNKSFSVESIIKWDGGSEDTFFSYKDSAGGTQKDIHWRIYTTGQLRFDFYSNSINSSAGSIVTGEYVHLVTTYNFGSDSCICYKNGEVLMAGSAGPFLGNDTNSTAYVGAWGTIQRFGGEIPILKMYNSAISASEIKQNYNTYKNRFNI
jgi:hypothetical protein